MYFEIDLKYFTSCSLCFLNRSTTSALQTIHSQTYFQKTMRLEPNATIPTPSYAHPPTTSQNLTLSLPSPYSRSIELRSSPMLT
jgi:hypothetical protein